MMQITKTTLALALAIAFVLSASVSADAIQLRPAPGAYGDFLVEVNPHKAMYNVGEPIRFDVAGNQGFYLYIFGIDRERNTGHLLLPNSLTPDNYFEGNMGHLVPGRQAEFFGDRPGVERIIFVASTRPIDLDTGRYVKSGNFLSADADTVEAQVKAIRIRPPYQAQQSATEIGVTIR